MISPVIHVHAPPACGPKVCNYTCNHVSTQPAYHLECELGLQGLVTVAYCQHPAGSGRRSTLVQATKQEVKHPEPAQVVPANDGSSLASIGLVGVMALTMLLRGLRR